VVHAPHGRLSLFRRDRRNIAFSLARLHRKICLTGLVGTMQDRHERCLHRNLPAVATTPETSRHDYEFVGAE
jgi:hypothetical protein